VNKGLLKGERKMYKFKKSKNSQNQETKDNEKDNTIDIYFESLMEPENIRNIDKSIVNEIYRISYENLENSEKKGNNLEDKAVVLIRTLGLCFTVLFALISFSAEPLKAIQNSCWLKFAVFLTFGSLLILIGITAIKVLKPISIYRTINVQDITEKEYMRNEIEYKLFLSWHYWKVYEENHKINEKKGWWLQEVYFGLLIPLFFILCTIIYFIFNFC